MSLESSIKSLIEKPINDLGYSLISVVFSRENNTQYLRVTIDRDDPIGLNDIVKVNEVVSPILDEADIYQNSYVLDITSLGIEKPIDVNNFEKYVGKFIHVHLSNPYKGENIIEGNLDEVNAESITLSYFVKGRKTKAILSRKDIDKSHLAIKF